LVAHQLALGGKPLGWLGVTLHRQNFAPPARPFLFRTGAGAKLPNENGPPAASACASSSTSAAIRWSRPATTFRPGRPAAAASRHASAISGLIGSLLRGEGHQPHRPV